LEKGKNQKAIDLNRQTHIVIDTCQRRERDWRLGDELSDGNAKTAVFGTAAGKSRC